MIYLGILILLLCFFSTSTLGLNFTQWLKANPFKAISLVALVATLLSVVPIVFEGRSFVSPNYGTPLLYDEFPTLPHTSYAETQDTKGSDIGAIMWQQVPFSALQHRSILRDAEIPVWSRYNSCGTPLLAQGQSMLGDPLHLIVILCKGSAVAWDFKYVLAKVLFSLSLGLCVFLTTRHLNSALLITIGSPFLGFFIFRLNHPAFFSLCYSPWVLYFYLKLNDSTKNRDLGLNLLGLSLANFCLITSGTVKEAYMLLACLNLSGFLVILTSRYSLISRVKKIGFLIISGILFLGLTAPLWYSFLETLKASFTLYDHTVAAQISASLVLGFFDEAFYRPLLQGEQLVYPSANLLILAGVLYFLATLRTQITNRTSLTLACVSIIPFSLAFGIIPPTVIEHTPFLKNIGHIGNTFSCVLIILASIIAGKGFATAAIRLKTTEGKYDLFSASLILASLLGLYFAFFHVSGNTNQVLSPFVQLYLITTLGAIIGLGLVIYQGIRKGHFTRLTRLLTALCIMVLLWRFAQYTNSSFSDYVVQPTHRVDFHAKSEAISYIQHAQKSSPSRSIGLQGNLWSGWSTYYGVEAINAPDALINPRYTELIHASSLDQQWGWRVYLMRPNLTKAKPFLDFLNVRYYLDLRSDQGALGSILKLDQVGDLDVYESKTVWPRAFFTDQIIGYTTVQDLMAKLSHEDGRPFAAMDPIDLGAIPNLVSYTRTSIEDRIVAQATSYSLTENSTHFSIRAPRSGIVVLNEVYWPGYPHAQIDGKPAKVFRINHTFQGLEVDQGAHEITINYRPRGFNLNLMISALSCFLLLGSSSLLIFTKDRNSRT